MDLNASAGFSVTQGGTISPSSMIVRANTARIPDFANGPNRLLGAVRVWVEEVVLANGGHAALESLHTAQQRSVIEVAGLEHLGGAVDILQPGNEWQSLPNGSKQHLIKMGVCVGQAWHHDPAARVNALGRFAGQGRRSRPDARNGSVFDDEISGSEHQPLLGHRDDRSIENREVVHAGRLHCTVGQVRRLR